MNKETNDTIICMLHDTMVVRHYSDVSLGVLKQYTPDHTSTLDLNYEYYISNSGQILYHEKDTSVFSYADYEIEVKKNMLKLSSDTIAPTYYHSQGDTRSASEIIGTIKPKAMLYKENEEYNDELNSCAFTLMLLIVLLYAYNSYTHWTSMITKIKLAIKN